MHLSDPLELLERADRWQMACGGPLSYAPPRPLHLDAPGFADECLWRGAPLPNLLRLSFLVRPEPQEGQASRKPGYVELFPYLNYWHWRPDRIAARYYLVKREGLGFKQQAGIRVFLEEVRRVEPDGSLVCEVGFDLLKGHPQSLQVVAWTVQEAAAPSFDGRTLEYRLPGKRLIATLSGSRKPAGAQAAPLAGEPPLSLADTPLWPELRRGRLSRALETRRGRSLCAGMLWRASLDTERSWRLKVRLGLTDRHSLASSSAPSAEFYWRSFFAAHPPPPGSTHEQARQHWLELYDRQLRAFGAPPSMALPGLPR